MSQNTQTRQQARTVEELQEISWRMSRQIIESTTRAGSGHPSSSLSAVDILTVLYFGGVMDYDPERPNRADRDRFIMSKGHAAPGLYVALANAGYFNVAMLSTLRTFGSPLEGHPVMNTLPGVEASTGSLGQGLSIGLGHALVGQKTAQPFRVYVMIGDGESDEGQIWEAAMAAAKFRTDNLTAILDFNGFQQTGPVGEIMPSLYPVVDKWKAFGWKVFEIDGHDIHQIQDAFKRARQVRGWPQIIIAHTQKGKGLSPFEEDEKIRKHGVPLTEEEAQIALQELDERYGPQARRGGKNGPG
ncbi:MAG: transketolase [Chloroflexi bacterium]|nr:transketolase [Chloroflexota bacterium]